MKALNFPDYSFKLRNDTKKTQIFDETRKKYYVLTPEEWVRQHVVEYLIREKRCPRNHIVIEKSLTLNKMQKRADVLIYNRKLVPALLVECKAPEVEINQDVFDQAGRYNMTFKVPFLVVTNGINHYCAHINFEKRTFEFLQDIPDYDDLQ